MFSHPPVGIIAKRSFKYRSPIKITVISAKFNYSNIGRHSAAYVPLEHIKPLICRHSHSRTVDYLYTKRVRYKLYCRALGQYISCTAIIVYNATSNRITPNYCFFYVSHNYIFSPNTNYVVFDTMLSHIYVFVNGFQNIQKIFSVDKCRFFSVPC